MLKFKGHSHFRQRLLCSTLSGRAIQIDQIRPDGLSPGLQDHEASLLRLIERVTNGCVVEISPSGAKISTELLQPLNPATALVDLCRCMMDVLRLRESNQFHTHQRVNEGEVELSTV